MAWGFFGPSDILQTRKSDCNKVRRCLFSRPRHRYSFSAQRHGDTMSTMLRTTVWSRQVFAAVFMICELCRDRLVYDLNMIFVRKRTYRNDKQGKHHGYNQHLSHALHNRAEPTAVNTQTVRSQHQQNREMLLKSSKSRLRASHRPI